MSPTTTTDINRMRTRSLFMIQGWYADGIANGVDGGRARGRYDELVVISVPFLLGVLTSAMIDAALSY